MTYDEALGYINTFGWNRTVPGLSRTRELLDRVGNPHKDLKFIHVAGTNGKGSTCAMIESVLRTQGYKTGFYPSPFIQDFRERIQVSGKMISKDDLTRLTETVAAYADAMDDHPTQFELVTAIGMLYFKEQKCDIVILEVGMGGIYDSTNVIDAPEAAVICNIGLDHTDFLGDTLDEIAWNKCGIIKHGCSVVSYDNVSEVMKVIEDTCRKENCRLYKAADEDPKYEISLIGKHQRNNEKTVLATIRAMCDRGWEISEESVIKGLKETVWPARFEVLSKEPVFILDGGHNPQCAQALTETLDEYLPGRKVIFIIGMLRDKAYMEVLRIIMPYAAEFITLTPDSVRALTASEMADSIRALGGKVTEADNAKEAIEMACKTGLPTVAFGSLYMAGDIRNEFCYTNE
ncbi:MAG: folylpolyglutamate synthase/dihydrofolate synthase family protein [Lachnospiraceae bacterium]|nr:folylpolyglutamate synthase/dihydrofolate synthase family protein [Lachnospiraceae bacterium]